MKLISVDQIEEGMLLAEDILSSDGTIYLGAGVVLKDRHRKLLDNLRVDYIYVRQVASQSLLSIDPVDIRRNQVFKQTLNTFKQVYARVAIGNQLVVSEIKEALEPLVTEIIDDNDILRSLRRIEVADEYTFKHSVNVGLIATMLGKWMGLEGTALRELSLAGLMHDLGKSQVPHGILNKPASLSQDEFEIMKTHALLSHALLSEAGGVSKEILRGVLEHHERMDGKGYPSGLLGRDIHLYARIIAVADVFDAMTSDRCYRAKQSPFTVADEMLRAAYGHLDVEIVSVFVQHISHFFVGNQVELSSGEVGQIIMVNPYAVTRPLVQLKADFVDLAKRYDLNITRIIK